MGPVLIAGVDAEERKTRYLDSILVRGVACLALTPPLALIAGEIAPEGGRLLSVSMAVDDVFERSDAGLVLHWNGQAHRASPLGTSCRG